MAKEVLTVTVNEAELNFSDLIGWFGWKAWRRGNPIEGDEPFWAPVEQSLDAGDEGVLRFLIPPPRGKVYFINKFGWSHFDDSVYNLSYDDGVHVIDGLTFDPQSESAQDVVLQPPLRVYKKIELRITNNSAKTNAYVGYFAGWKRWE